jgi:probable HAF family extracellular repeat protein
MRQAAVWAGVAMAVAGPAAAQTRFPQHPIVVSDNANVDATGINDHGSIVATVFDGGGTALGGLVVSAGSVTRLPIPYAGGGVAYPQAIDNENDVLGYAYESEAHVPHMFLIKDGAIDPDYNIVLVSTFGAEPFLQPNTIGIAARSIVFYTNVVSLSAPTDPAYGIPPHFHYVPEFNRFQTAKSINAAGIVAGTAYNLSEPTQVFMGQGTDFTLLTPPGATSVKGGYINAGGQVAGSYLDASGAPHGFVYAKGVYTGFDMPATAAAVSVTGINASGRVVGSFVAADGSGQHAFIYNGSTTTAFGAFAATDTVSVAVNSVDDMAVAVQSGLTYRSFAVACQGTGC